MGVFLLNLMRSQFSSGGAFGDRTAPQVFLGHDRRHIDRAHRSGDWLSVPPCCVNLLKRNYIPYLYGTRFRLSIEGVMSDKRQHPGDDVEPRGHTERRVRADAKRNLEALLRSAKAVFATSGVDAPVREIAERAGVGIGTFYRHFPQRADLIAAVFRHEIDACAEAAPILAAEHAPGEALAKWMQRYAAFIATKRGLAPALHSGNPAFETLRAYFEQRVRPALRTLLDSAVAAGEIRNDVESDELLHAVASLCMPAQDDGRAQRMVALLVDGLRCGMQRSAHAHRGSMRRSAR
jgi:AcrR family transcriptional regulator